MKSLLFLSAMLAAGLGLAQTSIAQDRAISGYIVSAVASPSRPKADTDRDSLRKPAELIAFAGLKPGGGA